MPNMVQVARNRRILLAIALGSTLLVYIPTLANGFIWDDHTLLLAIPEYWNLDLKALFTSNINGYEFLPVRDISLMFDAWIWGRNPFGFHLTNVVLHAVTTLLVFDVACKLSRLYEMDNSVWVGFWTALFFALHPLQVESVAFVLLRGNIIGQMLLLIAFNLYLSGRKGDTRALLGSALVFSVSLFSRASTVFFPVALLIMHLLLPLRGRTGPRLVLYFLALFLIDLLTVAMHLSDAFASGRVRPDIWRFGVYDQIHSLEKALITPFYYLYRILLPYPLSTHYPETFSSFGGTVMAFAALMMLALACWYMIARRDKLGLVAPGFAWFLVGLAPVSNIFPTHPVVADRYTYSPMFGIALIFGFLLAMSSRRIFPVLASIMLIGYGGLSFQRTLDWRDDRTLFKAAYDVAPEFSARAYAQALFDAGEYAEALAVLEEHPRHNEFRLYLEGAVASARNDHGTVIRLLKDITDVGTSITGAHYLLGKSYEAFGADDLALASYLKAEIQQRLDAIRPFERRIDEGIARIRSAKEQQRSTVISAAHAAPTNLQLQADAGLYLLKTGEYGGAIDFFTTAIQLDREYWPLWHNLGLAYKHAGRYQEAISALEKVVQLAPQQLRTRNLLGSLHALSGDHDRAIKEYRELLRVDSLYLPALYNLGRTYFLTGDHKNAERYLLAAQQRAGNSALRIKIDSKLAELVKLER